MSNTGKKRHINELIDFDDFPVHPEYYVEGNKLYKVDDLGKVFMGYINNTPTKDQSVNESGYNPAYNGGISEDGRKKIILWTQLEKDSVDKFRTQIMVNNPKDKLTFINSSYYQAVAKITR